MSDQYTMLYTDDVLYNFISITYIILFINIIPINCRNRVCVLKRRESRGGYIYIVPIQVERKLETPKQKHKGLCPQQKPFFRISRKESSCLIAEQCHRVSIASETLEN